MSTQERIVLVGGGLASVRCAQTLRAEGCDAAITLLCAEHHLPYDRPPLSKGLLADRTDATLPLLRPAAWYDDNRIELRLGERAIGLRPRERTVRLATGAAL